MEIVPERSPVPLFAEALNVTVPLPEPITGDVTVSQIALATTAHPHPAPAVTVTLPVPPATSIIWLAGATETEQAAS